MKNIFSFANNYHGVYEIINITETEVILQHVEHIYRKCPTCGHVTDDYIKRGKIVHVPRNEYEAKVKRTREAFKQLFQ